MESVHFSGKSNVWDKMFAELVASGCPAEQAKEIATLRTDLATAREKIGEVERERDEAEKQAIIGSISGRDSNAVHEALGKPIRFRPPEGEPSSSRGYVEYSTAEEKLLYAYGQINELCSRIRELESEVEAGKKVPSTFDILIQQLTADLPEGYEILIHAERGAASVELVPPNPHETDGPVMYYPGEGAEFTMLNCVREAQRDIALKEDIDAAQEGE